MPADHASVTSGWAYEAIDDPSDPAWSGHADARSRSRGRAALVAMGLVLVLLAVAAVAVLALAGNDAEPTANAMAPRASSDAPSNVTPPALPTVEPDLAAASSPANPDGSSVGDAQSEPGETRSSGSGWAPAEVTRPAYSADRVTGDTSGISVHVTTRLDELARALGRPVEVISGWRTRHEQSDLYQRYLAGTGNLAAVPGTSLHEVGRAADAYVDGVALADVPGARSLALALGLHFPVPGEPWHVELVGDPEGSGS